MPIIDNSAVLMTNVLTARAKRIADTPGSEEQVIPSNVVPLEDQVHIQDQAQKMQEFQQKMENIPRIDWETRTLNGQKISDDVFKEPTPEMLSGDQSYVVATNVVTGEKIYVKRDLPEKERVILGDMQHIQRLQHYIDYSTATLDNYNDVKKSQGKAPDPVAQSMLGFQKIYANNMLQRFLEETVIGYQRLGIDLQEAASKMSEMSDGQFDLSKILETYFGNNEQ